MTRARIGLFTGFLMLLAGCTYDRGSQTRWYDKFNLLGGPGPETAFIEYVVIDRPFGSDDINSRIWDRIDEHVIPYETRDLLSSNGFRVGTVSTTTPGTLRTMIDAPHSSIGHRFKSFAAEKTVSLKFNPLSKAEFVAINESGQSTEFQPVDAKFGFQVTIVPADGKSLVKFVPEMTHKDKSKYAPPGGAGIGWTDEITETFPRAAFEVPIGEGEYIVIGTDAARRGTLGLTTFSQTEGSTQSQKLIVLRVGKTGTDKPKPTLLNGKEDTAGAPTIATQASTIRGARP
jgi:hypothetical protein